MHHDLKIKRQGNIFDVNQIVFHSLDHLSTFSA